MKRKTWTVGGTPKPEPVVPSFEPREENVYDWTELSGDDVQKALVAVATHLGLRIVKITNPYWPEGHPDRVSFRVEKE